MASSFQQQSLRRKLVYFALILVLLTVTLVVRRADSYGMKAMADGLEIREENLGEADLLGSFLQLSLTGSRGVIICYYWYDAQEKQKKHEWNELDQRIHLLAKLQPHFITPWLFQSWNLAYNVSVEFDRVKDKYFYVARGIGLLAEGEKKNRDNPEMRFFIGNYTQSKIGISDENNTMRSFFQMSCMSPINRNPERFFRRSDSGSGSRELDLVKFEDFCQRHPHFVRRLRDHLRCKTPEDVIDFLAANQKIPSRYEQDKNEANFQSLEDLEKVSPRFKPEAERFPVLPPQFAVPGNYEEKFVDDNLGDDYDNYATSRAWYTYAQLPLDSGKYTKPLKMAKILFQGYPPRGQAYVAERREQEGWFDGEGWEITGWFPEDPNQPDGPKKSVFVGRDKDWAAEAWEKAYQMYRDHSRNHGLYVEYNIEDAPVVSPEDRQELAYKRNLSNIDHFFNKADVERTKAAVAGRKAFFKANQYRRLAEPRRAIELYESPEAFNTPANWAKAKATGWKKMLLDHPKFSHDLDQQEETYVAHFKYMNLLLQHRPEPVKQLLVLQDLLTGGALASSASLCAPLPVQLLPTAPLPFKFLPPFNGPLDDVDNEGVPFLSPEASSRAQNRIPGFSQYLATAGK